MIVKIEKCFFFLSCHSFYSAYGCLFFLLVSPSRIFHHFRGGAFSPRSATFATVTEAWRIAIELTYV